MAQYEVVDCLQRYYAKRQTGTYRFMLDLVNDIAKEMKLPRDLIEACLRRNGIEC